MNRWTRWTLLVVTALATGSFAVNCGGNSSSSSGATGGSSGITGNTPCLRACSNFQRFCGDPGCSSLCSALEAAYDVPLCPDESKSYLDCVASLQAADFACGADGGDASRSAQDALTGGARSSKCESPYAAFMQCNLTQGADCALQPALDESCAVVDGVHPHFQYCKLDVPQPANCVDYSTFTKGLYCCL